MLFQDGQTFTAKTDDHIICPVDPHKLSAATFLYLHSAS